jgi:hypothetical protein
MADLITNEVVKMYVFCIYVNVFQWERSLLIIACNLKVVCPC